MNGLCAIWEKELDAGVACYEEARTNSNTSKRKADLTIHYRGEACSTIELKSNYLAGITAWRLFPFSGKHKNGRKLGPLDELDPAIKPVVLQVSATHLWP
jgi:hypothetical protein